MTLCACIILYVYPINAASSLTTEQKIEMFEDHKFSWKTQTCKSDRLCRQMMEINQNIHVLLV